MQRMYMFATLFDVFVGGMFSRQVWIDEFASIRESRQRPAEPVERFAAHHAILRRKSYIYEMLKEGVQSQQELFFPDAVTQSKYTTKTDG